MSKSDESTATGSTLMRLPAEIRQIIFRMVIGDNLIHIYKMLDDDDEESQWASTHRVCHADVTGDCGSDSALPTTASSDSNSSFNVAHRECADLSYYRKENYLDFQIFETSHQIFQEAFLIFWRTSRFAFVEGDVLTRFLSYLSEAQTHNLKSIVICHRFCSFNPDAHWYPVFDAVKLKWASCSTRQAGFRSLRNLKNIELHLILDLVRSLHRIDYPRIVRTHFKAFEPLRLLSLEQASVTLSIFGTGPTPILFEDRERLSLATSFRDRLLDPTITKQDMADNLQNEIRRLERSARASEWKIKDLVRQIAAIQAQADQHQLEVDEGRGQAHRLQTILSRNDPDEMSKEIQMRTGESLELSGRDGDDVAES